MSWFGRHDVILEIVRDQNARLERENDWLRSHVEKLTTEVIDMKRTGFTLERTEAAPPMQRAEPLPPEVLDAITQRSQPGSQLAGELASFARGRLAVNEDPESIVDDILRGGRNSVR